MSKFPIRISDDLALPLDFVTQTQAILAMKRVGKTYTASVQGEELLKAGQQVVAIDITGAWWGLRSNAAGDGPGFPITIFGGDHGDLPLEKTAGEMLAEAIVSERFNAILDVSLLRKSETLAFLVAFLETLYRKNREAMHLFCDEADFYAPQKPYGEEIKTLGAMNDIVLRGGIRGIGCTLITQRPTRINKDVLTQCGILTCLRMSHPRDLEPIEEWVSEHSIVGLPAEMRKSMPSLPKGTAWFWTAGWPTEEGIFKKIQIRRRETFDSGATPKAGHKVATPKVMAKIDLEKLGERIAATAQRVKENDPTTLKRQVQELTRQLERQKAIVPQAKESSKSLAADRTTIQRLQKGMEQAMKIIANITAAGFDGTAIKPEEIKLVLDKASAEIVRIAEAGLARRTREFDSLKKSAEAILAKLDDLISSESLEVNVTATRNGNGDGSLPPGERAILIAVCQFGECERDQLSVLTGYKRSSRDAYIARLAARGYLELAGKSLRPTQEGIDKLGSDYQPLPTGSELYDFWRGRLPEGELKILDFLVSAAEPIERNALDEATGYKRSSRDAYLSRLSARRLIEVPSSGLVAASEALFD